MYLFIINYLLIFVNLSILRLIYYVFIILFILSFIVLRIALHFVLLVYQSFTNSWIYSFIHSLTHLFIYSSSHLFIYSSTHLLFVVLMYGIRIVHTHIHTYMHTRTHSLTHILSIYYLLLRYGVRIVHSAWHHHSCYPRLDRHPQLLYRAHVLPTHTAESILQSTSRYVCAGLITSLQFLVWCSTPFLSMILTYPPCILPFLFSFSF